MSEKSPFSPPEIEFITLRRAQGMDVPEILKELVAAFSVSRQEADVRLAIGVKEAEAEITPSQREIIEFVSGMADGSTPYQELRELAELRYKGKYTAQQIDEGLEAAMRLEQVFTKEELAYFERRAREGATDKVIATELTSRYGNKYTPDFISGERERRNLPAADADTVVKFTVKEGGRRSNFSRAAATPVPLPQQAEFPAPSPPVRLSEPKTRQEEYRVAAEKPDVPAPDVPKVEARHINIKFEPVPVKTFIDGRTYMYAGAGAVVYIGMENSKVGGIETRLSIFDQIHDESATTLRKSSETQSRKKVRELATPQIMEQVLRKIEFGLSDISRQSLNNNRLKSFYEDKLASPDIADVTDLLCLLRGHSRRSADVGATDFEYGEKAKKIIASEYAVVMKVEYKEALRLVDEALSKTAPMAAPASFAADRPKTLGQ